MDRVTGRNQFGAAYYVRCFETNAPCGGTGAGDECSTCKEPQIQCEKLAAYEDSGIKPEEMIELLRESFGSFHKSLSHAIDLLKAEADGRLMILPCKPGDTVYFPFAGRVLEKKVTAHRSLLRPNGSVDSWYEVAFNNAETFDDEGIGKTVFLAREEAEAALKERGK